MRHSLGIVAALPQALGNGGKLFRRFFSEELPGFLGFQAFRVGEGVAQLVTLCGVAQVFELEFVSLVNRIDEIGVDMDLVHVRHNQQRWIVKRQRILPELRQGGVEVFALALVFPAETILAPHISPAFAARGFGRHLFRR